MKGDFTRFTHDPEKHYSRVLKQQGRVDLDADWNEQGEIQEHLDQTTHKDIIGPCGVPKIADGFKIQAGVNLRGVSFVNRNRGWIVGSDATILTSADGGKNWTKQNAPSGIQANLNAVDFISKDKGWIVGDNTTILATNDGGNTWNLQKLPILGYKINLNALDFIDDKKGWIVGDNATIFFTNNGGKTWEQQQSPAEVMAHLRGIDFLGGKGIIVGDDATILTTDDFGKTWKKQNPPEGVTVNLRCVDIVEEQYCYAAGDSGTFLISSNGGNTWKREISHLGIKANLFGISAKTPTQGWAVGDLKTIITLADASRTYSSQTQIVPDNFRLRAVSFYDTDYGWAVGDGGIVLMTTNGGKSWTTQIIPLSETSLTISSGRIYVDGILCELKEDISYLNQPDYPNPPQIKPGAGPSPGIKRTDLIYIDVWQRHITALEDPEIREVALGGPDTTTRVKTVWQVKVMENVGVSKCRDSIKDWPPAPSSGRLSTSVVLPPPTDDPCIISPKAGYRGLENRLYRVEIHRGGNLDQATFKWSRDNASVIYAIEEFIASEPNKYKVRVKQLGRDTVLALKVGDGVEILGDETELKELPGTIAIIENIDEAERIITLRENVSQYKSQENPKIIKWNQEGDAISVSKNGHKKAIDLEDGIQVKFSGDNFKTGDYWVFAARTATGDIEHLNDAPPMGIHHHYCKLALITWIQEKKQWKANIQDCRRIFPPLTDICISDKCHDFLDDLRADGIVRGSDGKLGFEVNKGQRLTVNYTGGTAYVAGCRYEIPSGSFIVDESTTHQTLLVNDQGQVALITKGELPEKYAEIAIISTYQGEIKRILDTRFDLTHLDKTVENNRTNIATRRADRRQFVPLLAFSIKGLQYCDGRDRIFDCKKNFSPSALASDGDNIWVANSSSDIIARIPRDATAISDIKLFSLNVTNGISKAVAYDGCCLWFTLSLLQNTEFGYIVRLNPKTQEICFIKVGADPRGVAFDGEFVWVCCYSGGSIMAIDVETCQIARVDNLKRTLDRQGITSPESVVYDGTHIWIAAVQENVRGNQTEITPKLFRIEKPWGDVEEVNPPNGWIYSEGFMAFDGNNIWISSKRGPIAKLDINDPHHGQLVFSNVIKSSDTITFDGSFLWIFQGKTFYKVDVLTNQIIGQGSFQGPARAAIFDGTHLWSSISRNLVLKKLV